MVRHLRKEHAREKTELFVCTHNKGNKTIGDSLGKTLDEVDEHMGPEYRSVSVYNSAPAQKTRRFRFYATVSRPQTPAMFTITVETITGKKRKKEWNEME
jgi:hypothetical protein